MSLIPNKDQFSRWNMPSKWSFIGGIIGIIGLILTLLLPILCNKNKEYSQSTSKLIDHFIIDGVIEGSELCCRVRPIKAHTYLNPEGTVEIPASYFMQIPSTISKDSILSIAYSVDPSDTIKTFYCKNFGTNNLSLFYFINNEVFCAQRSILEVLDPNDFCLGQKPKKRD